VTPAARLAEWLDVRPTEVRLVLLTFAGAFVMMAFVVLSRALREAFFLDRFDASALPYVGGAAIGLGLVAAGLFARALVGFHPSGVLRTVIAALGVSLAVLYPFVTRSASMIVSFYLLTAVGTLLITSGFWLVVSELFVVREAKRLFGVVSAGGTLGLLVAGTSIRPLLALFAPRDLLIVLIALLGLSMLINELVPKHRLEGSARTVGSQPKSGEGLRLVLGTPHVRLIAAVILLVSAASAVVDFQFKEAVQQSLGSGPAMAVFFGDFYAWTGGLALVIQLLLTTRFLTAAGIAWSVALVPLVVAFGSAGMLLAPGLVAATGLRGADSTLRKSIFRSVMEFLWVPVPHDIRRRTKTVVDSVADAAGEGLGFLLVLLWVTLPGFSSRWLSLFVIGVCLALIALSQRLGREYFATLRSRLADGAGGSAMLNEASRGGDPLAPTLSRLDITRVLNTRGIELGPATTGAAASPASGPADDEPDTLLRSGDIGRITEFLRLEGVRDPELVPVLARLLARDRLLTPASEALLEIGAPAVPGLALLIANEGTDFVIRRRIPRVLARISDPAAEEALLSALRSGRFEVRYRAAVALVRRRAAGLPGGERSPDVAVWEAIREELGRGRAVWELARLLDDVEPDPLVGRQVGLRGELSLEHVFRLLSLVLDSDPIRASYRSLLSDDDEARSFALEYLDQVLPPDVKQRLWPFIGDLSEHRKRQAIRPLDDVVADLIRTGATLFGGTEQREALRRYLSDSHGPGDPLDPAGD
jgi:AAA family ATP:ADP antiporter